jgi:hypothetical protein
MASNTTTTALAATSDEPLADLDGGGYEQQSRQ